jgi:hypothetical protein
VADVITRADINNTDWYYIVEDLEGEADSYRVLSEVVETVDDAWLDALTQFKLGRL